MNKLHLKINHIDMLDGLPAKVVNSGTRLVNLEKIGEWPHMKKHQTVQFCGLPWRVIADYRSHLQINLVSEDWVIAHDEDEKG